MGKKLGKKRKLRTPYQDGYGNPITDSEEIVLRKQCIKNFIELLNEIDNNTLLRMAESVCGSDYAVGHFKKNPNCKSNRELLEKAIRRSYSMGAFNHRETIIDYLTGSR